MKNKGGLFFARSHRLDGNAYENIYSKKNYNLSMHSHAEHGNEQIAIMPYLGRPRGVAPTVLVFGYDKCRGNPPVVAHNAQINKNKKQLKTDI